MTENVFDRDCSDAHASACADLLLEVHLCLHVVEYEVDNSMRRLNLPCLGALSFSVQTCVQANI